MDNILSLVIENRLLEAFNAMDKQALAIVSKNAWEIQDRLQNLRQSYNYMLEYFSRGIADSQQQTVYSNIQKDILLLNEQICFELRLMSGATASRYTGINQGIEELAQKLELFQSNISEHESAITLLFNRIWSWTGIWSAQEHLSLNSLIQNSAIQLNDKLIVISAITLSCLEEFHPLKYKILLSLLDNTSAEIKARAAVGTVIIAYKKNSIINFFPELVSQIKIVSDNSNNCSLICSTWFNIQRCIESLDIEKMMTQEILPTIVKQSQKALEEIDDINPDWEKLSSNTQLQDKIEKLNQLQQEGADVYLSTFRHLKSGAFFNEAVNCLRPFDINIPQVQNVLSGISDKHNTLSSLIEKSVMMCNSDKYSLCFTLASVGGNQYSMLLNQLEEQNEFVNSSLKSQIETMSGLALTESMIRIYIQDLFRLFALQWKNNKNRQIYNVFENEDNFITESVLKEILADTALQNKLLDFYIRKGYYDKAFKLCHIMEQSNNPDTLNYKFFQKYGYAAERRKDTDSNHWNTVLALYSKADLLNSDQVWTWKHLANTYGHLGMWSKSAEYWNMVLDNQIDNVSTVCNAAHALTMSGNIDKALQLLYKAFYLNADSIDIIKEIAVTETLNSNIDNAAKYWNKVELSNMSASDLIQLGHLHYISGNIPIAFETYSKALNCINGQINPFRKLFLENSMILEHHNIDPTVINLIIDAVIQKK